MEELDRAIRRAELMFGFNPCDRDALHTQRMKRASSCAAKIDAQLGYGQIALIIGPSGSGKTLVARAMFAMLQASGSHATWITSPNASTPALGAVLDAQSPSRAHTRCTTQSLVEAMRTMARAGLAEAGVFSTPTRDLSDGQRARLALATGCARADGGRATLIADEFCSTLDRTTAACVSASIARWLRVSRSARLVCVSAHHDLRQMLAPEIVVVVPIDDEPSIEKHRAPRKRGGC